MYTSITNRGKSLKDKMIENYYILNQIVQGIDTGILIIGEHRLLHANNEARRIGQRTYRELEAGLLSCVAPGYRCEALRAYFNVLYCNSDHQVLALDILLPDGARRRVRCRFSRIRVSESDAIFVSIHGDCCQQGSAPAAPRHQTHGEAPSGYDFRGKRVIVAEDADINFMLMQKMLERTGISILRATNGEECISLYRQNPDISLILMDMQMPVMDGYQAAGQILAMDASVPIIAQTAFDMMGERQRLMDIGCVGFVSKPIDRALLLDTIQRLAR